MTMSGSGISSGSGGGAGGAQDPSINEREQTAANAALKVGMGLAITKDTLDVSFTQVGGQIGRYPSEPNRPSLPPLVSSRGPSGFESDSDTSWKQALTALVNMLPPAVKNDYEAQMALPIDQRNLNFVALDNVLTKTAMTLTWLQNATGAKSTEGVAAADRLINLSLPGSALEGLIANLGEILQQSTGFLDSVGANYPQQDALRAGVRSANNARQEMQELMEEMSTTGEKPIQKFAALSDRLTNTSEQYDRVYSGDDLSIIGVSLSAMAMTTSAMAISDKASSAMFIALAISSVGLETQNSATGVMGSSLATVTTGISNGITALLMPQADAAIQYLMNMYVTTIVVAAATLATLVNDVGLGYIPPPAQDKADEEAARDAADVQAARDFTTNLALNMTVKAGLVSSTISALTETFGLAPMQQQYLEASLNLLALTTMVLAITPGGNPEKTAELFDGLQVPIAQNAVLVSEMISDALMDQSIGGPTAISVGIAQNQAKTAIEGGDISGFISALLENLGTLGTTQGQLMQDIGGVRSYANDLSDALTTGMNDQTNTETRISIIV